MSNDSVRINKPKGIEGQKLVLLIHHGYDFDPTTLAVCSSLEKAREMFEEHYANPDNKDMPWNSVHYLEVTLDDWIDYGPDIGEERSLISLAKQVGLV